MNQIWDEFQIIKKIKDIVLSTFNIDLSDKPDTMPIGDLGLDSMGILDVIMSLEDVIGQNLKNIDLPKNPTLRDVADMVIKNMQAGGHD
ncbi:acyl carrier protein [Thiomonas sp.]|uniref:Carrier domain-containing protein n=1 Tax=mine drainage metagenome TaxID=410659 RepID=E6PQJ1_9ZZZZ